MTNEKWFWGTVMASALLTGFIIGILEKVL